MFAGTKVGDLVEDKTINVLCHQCNCQACMGGGIAYQIAGTYPEVSRRDGEYYSDILTKTGDTTHMLGKILPTILSDHRICVNMYSQYDMGGPDSIDPNDIDSVDNRTMYFKSCLDQLEIFLKGPGSDKLKTVGFPKYIGCGLAGGYWPSYEKLILEFADKVDQEVYIVSLY